MLMPNYENDDGVDENELKLILKTKNENVLKIQKYQLGELISQEDWAIEGFDPGRKSRGGQEQGSGNHRSQREKQTRA